MTGASDPPSGAAHGADRAAGAAESEAGPLRRPRWIEKRDGRQAPFDAARIAAAVRRAQEAVGEDDPPFAHEVADVVALTLAARARAQDGFAPAASEVPRVEDVQDLVEDVLVQMGRARLAKAYILYRDRRARARAALRIHERPDRSGRAPWVRDGAGTSPWNGGRIVAALMEEADLPRELAEEVAERVEGRVVDAGLRRLSTSLIREFVDNELMAMGLETALHRQEPVGLPRHDLRRFLGDRPRDPQAATARGAVGELAMDPAFLPRRDLEAAVSGAILERYCLADVLDERTADLHKAGSLDVVDLARPHRVLTRALPAELFLHGEPGPRVAFDLIEELAPIAAGASRGVVLERAHDALAPLVRGARGPAALREWLHGLSATAHAAGVRIDLSGPGGRAGAFVARLVTELAPLAAEGRVAPRLFLSWEEIEPAIEGDADVAEAAEYLLQRGRIVPVWNAKDERWVAPGCRRRPRERGALACAGAVALNLPRLARQAGPWREDLLFEALAARVQSSLDALESLDAFQRRHPAARAEDLRERTLFAIVPVGLAEALRILGDGEVRPTQGARLLGVLAEATRRFAADRSLSVVTSPFFADESRTRFARLDAHGPRASQPRLFSDLPAPEEEREEAYGAGYSLPAPRPGEDAAERGRDQARFCGTLRTGALWPWLAGPGSAGPGSGGSGSAGPPVADGSLATWRAFHVERFAAPDPVSASPSTARRGTTRAGDVGPLFRAPR